VIELRVWGTLTAPSVLVPPEKVTSPCKQPSAIIPAKGPLSCDLFQTGVNLADCHRGCPRSRVVLNLEQKKPPIQMLRREPARAIFAVFMVLSLVAFGRSVGVDSPWFGLVTSFSVLGLMDLAMPIIRICLPTSLRRVRPWEQRAGAYRTLGVPAFGAFIRGTPVRWLNRKVYLGAHPKNFELVRIQLENAEAAHFWGGIATLPYLALAWIRGWWGNVAAVVLFNLVVNVYPILHLRSVRVRLERASRRVRSSFLPRRSDDSPGASANRRQFP
jgi:hypothetical protein